MTPEHAAAALETILAAENDALARHDATAAVAYLPQKLAAAEALGTSAPLPPETIDRLRELAAENRRLLEIAIRVQSQIVNILVRAAQSAANQSRYAADGRTLRPDSAIAIAKQA